MSEPMAHVLLVRSQLAAGTVASVDVSTARDMPGVLDVLTPGDVAGRTLPDGSAVLAETVRYQGQPIAAVVADSEYVAADAAETLDIVLEPVDPEGSAHCAPDDLGTEPRDPRTYVIDQPRWHLAPLQTQQCIATSDDGGHTIVVRTPVRDVEGFADALGAASGLSGRIRVESVAESGRSAIVDDLVGVGHVVAVLAADRVGRRVRWQESRAESLTSGGAQAGFHASATYEGKPGSADGSLSIRVVLDVGAGALPPSVDLSSVVALPWYGVGDLEVEAHERRSHLPPAHTDAARVLGPVLAVESLLTALAREMDTSRHALQEAVARSGGSVPLALIEAVCAASDGSQPAGSTARAAALAPGVAARVSVALDEGTGEWVPASIALAVPGTSDSSVRLALRAGAVDGYGLAAMQQIPFDEQGTCLGATLMDYVMPSSAESPYVAVVEVGGVEATPPLAPGLARLVATAAVAAAARNALSTLVPGLSRLPLPIRSCDVLEAAGIHMSPTTSARAPSQSG